MSRELAFWNDETLDLIRGSFVAVAVPTWVCHAEGPEGEFLRGAGIDDHWVTSSGYLHCVSASGKLLGRRPSTEVLDAFAALPDSERMPGAVEVQNLPPSASLIPSPPEHGIVLKVHARFLARDGQGGWRHATPRDFPLMRDDPKLMDRWALFLEPNTEYLWLRPEEWRSMIPDNPEIGQRFEADPAIALRMARFHLNPKRATTSEGGIVNRQSVTEASLHLTVAEVTPQAVALDLRGRVHWGSEFDAAQATSPDGPLAFGYESPLLGRIEIDRAENTITRFDMVAPGDVWGRWGDANNKSMDIERPGRAPFGFAFELATGQSPTERIPPGGNPRTIADDTGYFPASQ
ncbi:hypothetical protein BH23VER1_BH23VER1_19380 [soil metagenome]